MVFQSAEWRMVEAHYPLVNAEIASLREHIRQDAALACALVLMAEAIVRTFTHTTAG